MSSISRLKADLQADGRLWLLNMIASEYQYQGLENLLCNYVEALKTNIDRIALGFKPYGKTQVQTIAEHLTSSMPADQKATAQEEIKTEFAKLKYDMLTWKQDLPEECNLSVSPCKVTATEWCLRQICSLSHFYSKISNMADIMLSTPVSNAWPERGASCVKRVKTRFRSTLKSDMLQSLLEVSINGPANGTNDSKGIIERSVKAWSSAKNRRSLPRARRDTAELISKANHSCIFLWKLGCKRIQ
ncbi:hypothetical protein AWC38_SpisGene8855 [Stylophora pistillata]|uniref:HAT C-terminal dimerisation domain-containing protein n=1 Tax=Stylophora pistillata TaxID=50429 RepID=A0A2B4S749_STYPI|nr:hypothetical protein AWC38_SpisGene8855 [Stylophora pistillata]